MPDNIHFSSPLRVYSFTQDITYCIYLVNIIIMRYPHVRIANLFLFLHKHLPNEVYELMEGEGAQNSKN